MNKPILILTAAACGVALGIAATFWSDLQRERTRADALAERVAVFEPVERDDPSRTSNKPASNDSPPRVERVAEPPHAVADPPKPALKGSARALQQVELLRLALGEGTPLQDYQARALVAAIDRFRPDGKIDVESHTQLRDAVADILFESQFETYLTLFERESLSRPR